MKSILQHSVLLLSAFLLLFGANMSQAQTPIACNGDVNASLSANGEVDVYTFDAEPGDIIIIRMQQNNSDIAPKLRLTGPGIDLTKIGGYAAARIGAVQLDGGSYTIYASDNGNNDTGNYGISLQFIKGGCAQAIGCDADLTASLSRKAEMDAFIFEVVDSGGFVIARVGRGTPLLDCRLELYKIGNATPIDTVEIPDSPVNAARIDAANLMPGTYVLVLLDLLGDKVGSYGLSFQLVKGECAQPITCDADLISSFSNNAEMNAYTFEVTDPGGFVIAQIAQFEVAVVGQLELYLEGNPTPVGIVENPLGSSGIFRIKAPNLQPGKYVLIASNWNSQGIGSYGLSLQFINASCSEPINCEDDLFDGIHQFGEVDAYTFEISDTVNYAVARMVGYYHLLDCVLELYRNGSATPLGNYSTPLSGYGGAEFGAANLLPGTYTILAFSKYGSDTGRYFLSLELLTPECAQEVNCVGGVGGVLEYQGGLDTYYFDREFCNEMEIKVSIGDTWGTEMFWLYGEDGTLINSATGGLNTPAELTVELSDYPFERYFIVIGDDDATYEGSYYLELQCQTALQTTPSPISNNALGGSKQLIIDTECPGWTLVGGTNWFSIDQTSGSGKDTVTVSFEPNLITTNRSTNLTLSGCCKNLNINVFQTGATLSATPNPLNVSNEGGTTSFFVNSFCIDWSITLPAGVTWISPAEFTGTGSKTVFLTADPNCSGTPRSTTITLSGCGLTVNILVTQAGTIFDTSPSPVNLGVPTGQAIVNLISNCNDWVIEGDVAADWLSLSQSSGSYNGNFALDYENNYSPTPRTAVLTATGCCATIPIGVVQAGAMLSANPTSFNLSSGTGQASLDVSSNCDEWMLTEDAAWLNITPSQGSFNGLVLLNFDANTDCTNRTDTIILAGCGIEYSLLAMQVADTMPSITPNSLITGADAGGTSIMVSGNCLWTASEDDDWVSISVTGGVVSVDFEQNATGLTRTAVVDISCCGETSSFELTQLAFTLTATPSEITVGNNAGQGTFDIDTGCDNWIIEESIPWLEVTPSQGSLSGPVNFSYTENSDTIPRQGSFLITGCGLSDTIYLSQNGVNAVAEHGRKLDLRVFPNPSFANAFTVEIPSGLQSCTLNFCDVMGRKIKTLPVQSGTQALLPTTELPSGIYLFQLQANDGRVELTKKVILIRDK